MARYSQKITASIGRVAQINYQALVTQYRDLLQILAAAGGRPASLRAGPPVDASSSRPAVIGSTEWRNTRSW